MFISYINARNEAVESEVDKERLKKMARKTTALLAGGAIGWLIGGELFEDPKVELPSFPKAPGVPDVPQIPNVPDGHIVISGENVWKIIESDLDSKNMMADMTEGNRTFVIDALKDKFEAMSPTELKGLGFSSGDLNLIYAGENLNLSSVLNEEHITKTLLESRNLTADQITQIIQNNATIAQWLAQHQNELTGLFNSSLIEKILNIKA